MTTAGAPVDDAGVVVHLSAADAGTRGSVLRNVRNLVAGWSGPPLPVEVVVHGSAVAALLVDAPEWGAVDDLVASGVAFSACANSLRSLDLTADDLAPAMRVVPSGVVRLVEQQRRGWTYLRP